VVNVITADDTEGTESKSIIPYMKCEQQCHCCRERMMVVSTEAARGDDSALASRLGEGWTERELFMEAVEAEWHQCDADVKARVREAAEKGYRGRDDELFEEVSASGGAFELYSKTRAQGQ
jgi:hypothetical protein